MDFITLGARTPHCGAFGLVEHPELEGGVVRDYSHVSAKRVYLPDDLSLGNSAHRRVAGHLGKTKHVHADEQDGRTQVGRRHGSLASGVTSAHNYDIVIERH